MGPFAYVHAGENRTKWVDHVESNPDVRLLASASLYELKAQRVSSQEEFDEFSNLYEKKYDRRPGNENVREAYLYRLGRRD